MKTYTFLAFVTCIAAASGTVACGQKAPPPPSEPASVTYHPLVDGAWWEYDHRGRWTERVTLTAMDGAAGFIMSDSPNPSDDLRSDSIITNVGGRISRMTKDEYLVASTGEVLTSSVTYGVGFTRFNEGWVNQAVGFKESPEYVRVETPPGGTAQPGEARKHTFEIMSLSEEVMTAVGTFDCIVIRRTKDWQAEADGLEASDAQTKTFWFGRGVGKVQERNEETGSTELLTAFEIPVPTSDFPY
jgi:hypothetical protein